MDETRKVDERKRAEQELREIIDSIPAVVWVALPDGSNIYANSRFVEYSGMVPAQTAGSGWRMAVHTDDLQKHEGKWRASVASGEPHESEVRFRGADGEYRWHLDRGLPLRDEEGNIIKWYGVVTDIEDRKRVEEALRADITERKTAEDTIREQEAELRQVLDFAPQLIGVLGPRLERRYANRVALAYYGVSLDEWRQTRETEIHPDDVDRVKAHFARWLTSGAPSELEMEKRLRGGDGTYRWFLVRYNPLRDDQGQIVRWYIAGTDIEDRKRDEDKLQQENAALREEIDETSMFEEIVGTSPALQTVL